MEPENKPVEEALKSKIIFVATYPDDKGVGPEYLFNLETQLPDTLVLHPSYDLTKNTGKAALEVIKALKHRGPVKTDNTGNDFSKMVARDFWLVSVSDLLIYDLDVNPGTHFLALAISQNIPILGISDTLRTCPIYFSGNLQVIIRPESIAATLKKTS